MLKSLARIVALVLSAFPTTADNDQSALVAAGSDADVRTAIQFRLEKKRSLVDALRSIASRVKVRKSLYTAWPSSSLQRSCRRGVLLATGDPAGRLHGEQATQQCQAKGILQRQGFWLRCKLLAQHQSRLATDYFCA